MAIQRRARGFRSHASFRIAALFHGGGLNLLSCESQEGCSLKNRKNQNFHQIAIFMNASFMTLELGRDLTKSL
jgi:hypothetical protein